MARRIEDPLAYYVYALYRDVDLTIPFFIGKGKGRRWLQHETAARHVCEHHRCRVVRLVVRQFGAVPKRKLAEGLTTEQACALEIALIAQYGREPEGPLINQTRGGDGVVGRSPEVLAKMSASHKGVKLPPERAEHCRRLGEAKRGVPRTPEEKEKMAAAKRGIPRPPYVRAKLRAANLAKSAQIRAEYLQLIRRHLAEMRNASPGRYREGD